MKNQEIKSIRRTVVLFMICLILSGLTAFPIRSEISYLMAHRSELTPTLQHWIETLDTVLRQTPDIVLYGTDWLAFAHIVIAGFFLGVYIDPVKNKFIVQVGIAACIAVFPLAFICGPLRGIPFFHQLIDCGFGVIGLIPLSSIYRQIRQLEIRRNAQLTNVLSHNISTSTR